MNLYTRIYTKPRVTLSSVVPVPLLVPDVCEKKRREKICLLKSSLNGGLRGNSILSLDVYPRTKPTVHAGNGLQTKELQEMFAGFLPAIEILTHS